MITSEKDELRDIIHRHYEATGMRATHADIMHDLVVPQHVADWLVRKGLSGQITSYFSAHREDGLPFAPVVNDLNEHVPLDLAEFAELEYVAAAAVNRGLAEFQQARKVGALARERYGRSIIVNGIDLSAEKQDAA